jgi:predicted ATPase with chaperone activity
VQRRHACGEIRQFYRLPDDGQSLMQAEMSQLNLLAPADHCTPELARTFADLEECEEVQFMPLAGALHVTWQTKVDDWLEIRSPSLEM